MSRYSLEDGTIRSNTSHMVQNEMVVMMLMKRMMTMAMMYWRSHSIMSSSIDYVKQKK